LLSPASVEGDHSEKSVASREPFPKDPIPCARKNQQNRRYRKVNLRNLDDLTHCKARYLDVKEAADRRRKKSLCKAWNEYVFNQIQDQINQSIFGILN
jgi:hypothetical protein